MWKTWFSLTACLKNQCGDIIWYLIFISNRALSPYLYLNDCTLQDKFNVMYIINSILEIIFVYKKKVIPIIHLKCVKKLINISGMCIDS